MVKLKRKYWIWNYESYFGTLRKWKHGVNNMSKEASTYHIESAPTLMRLTFNYLFVHIILMKRNITVSGSEFSSITYQSFHASHGSNV